MGRALTIAGAGNTVVNKTVRAQNRADVLLASCGCGGGKLP